MAEGTAKAVLALKTGQELEALLKKKKIIIFTKTEQSIIIYLAIQLLKQRDSQGSAFFPLGQKVLAEKIARHEKSVKNALQSLEAKKVIQTTIVGKHKECKLLLSGDVLTLIKLLCLTLCGSSSTKKKPLSSIEKRVDKKSGIGARLSTQSDSYQALLKKKRKELQNALEESRQLERVVAVFREREYELLEEWTEEIFAHISSLTANFTRSITAADRKAIKELVVNKQESLYSTLDREGDQTKNDPGEQRYE